jgi:hypothetical protein
MEQLFLPCHMDDLEISGVTARDAYIFWSENFSAVCMV